MKNVFTKTAVVKTFEFMRNSAEFALPGVVVGSAAILATSPIIAGVVLISTSQLLWLVLFMLGVGVCIEALRRYMFSRIDEIALPDANRA